MSEVRPRALLIGGTSDARAIADALYDAGFSVGITVATAHGALLAEDERFDVHVGRLDADSMSDLASRAQVVIDASHPYATGATETARSAATKAGVPYLRFARAATTFPDDVLIAADADEAARMAVEAAGEGGTVLLTTGSRTVSTYAAACREAGVRCIARILPVEESFRAVDEAGLSADDIVALHGPVSPALESALLFQNDVDVLVTKDGGEAAVTFERVMAARAAGARAVVVARPIEVPDALSDLPALVDEALRSVGLPAAEQTGIESSARDRSDLGLIHVYTGNAKGKTTAGVGLAVRAIGAGLRVAFVQFIKGGRESSELEMLRRLGAFVARPATRSSGLMTGDATDEDRRAARIAFDVASETVLSGRFDLVVLDEVNIAVTTGLVSVAELVDLLGRRCNTEVALTGRNAANEIVEMADYVTELVAHKHPYERGIVARKGIEY